MCQCRRETRTSFCSQPVIDSQNCKKCGICIKHCAHEAIYFDAQHIAEIDYSRCVGCGQCVALCQYDAAVMGESDTSERLNYKIAEYTQAVLKDKPHFHISFIMNVSPECVTLLLFRIWEFWLRSIR